MEMRAPGPHKTPRRSCAAFNTRLPERRFGGPLIALGDDRNREHARFPHSRNRQRFALLTLRREDPVLDKAGGDMVHLRVNLRPPK